MNGGGHVPASQYLRHLERRYFPRHEEWSISVRYRDQLPTHGCNTSNIVERAFRIEKDNCFNRTMAYNVVEVLNIKLDDHEHYRRRQILRSTESASYPSKYPQQIVDTLEALLGPRNRTQTWTFYSQEIEQ